ncbi:DUF1707 domain-containing protein [Nonomuraea sp. ZG12]|uniref:DUF1707 domain-containing protein n=1 Tax=Nonomuraea sp. ZG12 TaxID=3452207 RepID=UPI003F8C933E
MAGRHRQPHRTLTQHGRPETTAHVPLSDIAIAHLHDAFAAGRLTSDELAQRLENAMTSRTQADLGAVLAGLRGTSPAQATKGSGRLKPLLAGWLSWRQAHSCWGRPAEAMCRRPLRPRP